MERASVDPSDAGVAVASGEDLGACAGLGERHVGRTVGDVAGIGVALAGLRVEREGGDAAVAGRDDARDVLAADQAAEGGRGAARGVDHAGAGGVEAAHLQGAVVHEHQRATVEGRVAGERVYTAQLKRACGIN